MMTVCPVCGKYFVAHWPEHWVYRRGEYYMCSERCLDLFVVREYKERTGWIEDYKRRKTYMQKKITLEQKKKAVEIAIGGGDPMKYLAKCGAANPSASWWYIRKVLSEKDPETFRKLNAVTEQDAEDPEEPVADVMPQPMVNLEISCEDLKEEPEMEMRINEEDLKAAEEEIRQRIDASPVVEQPKTFIRPLNYDGFDVMMIKNEFGQFHYDAKFNLLDWTSPDGEEVSFSPDSWKTFATEVLPKAMAILGAVAKN